MSVLVTSASGAKALVITRSLGRRDIEVTTTDCEQFSAAFFSKYSKSHFVCPSPTKSPLEFKNVIEKEVKKRKIEVLMPINSTETLLIAMHKNKLELYTKIPFADHPKMLQLHNKDQLVKIATELGLPTPKTCTVKDVREIRNIAEMIEYPAVLKLKDATSSMGIQYVNSKDEFIYNYKQSILDYNLDPSCYPLIQEFIPGDGYGVSVLFNQGDLRALFTHKRLREYPITGGPSTFRESVRHPEMEEIAIKLLEYIDWHGVAMVEFKLDKRTNKPVLIEVNPRFWGSINQAITAGVDFPYLLYKMATEGDITPVLNYKLGVRTRFLMNDLRALFSHLRHSNNRVQILKDFLNFDGIMSDDIISCKDPLPMMFFAYTNMKELLRRNQGA
ncbi:MAG: carboxylate-amine ligase [Candidatus Syntrophoarchaeum caldarius]|uniref:Carboxylate-amine ligase n=1 Tax=Candidatus Syntropharchaeum caldarium TaxID=1838285 RepID=A0A1F2P8U9_9EURY|nr:MAG: carboxylate-amine ligase [Candidatus Syntrophoarchaeum caldarius]